MEFEGFLKRVLPPLGLAPRPHHRRGVRRKLSRRLDELHLRDWDVYAALVESDPAERQRLAALVSVTISRFLRNRTLWEFLGREVLPTLCDRQPRLWSCGCASGEEPFSLAILWRETCPGGPVNILATDIDPVVLARAEAGLYAPGSLREMPPELRGRYFRPEKGGLRLSERVRGMVELRRHDLAAEPVPGGPFDLILCRNLAFTYFAEAARVEVALKLVASLSPGGWLAVGRKERLPQGVTGLLEAGYPGLYRRSEIRSVAEA